MNCRSCSPPFPVTCPVNGQRHSRSALLKPANARLSDVVGRYLAALGAGDLDSIVSTFASDGYFRGSIGPEDLRQGTRELRSYFAGCFSVGGGLKLQN